VVALGCLGAWADQVIPRAPRLASPQAMITLFGLNFGLAQLLISSAYRNDVETHELLASDVMPHFA